MLKRRELQDAPVLFPLVTDEAVKPYVREKVDSIEEYYFFLNKMINDEEKGQLISRTIMDDWENPIGAITLYDIQDGKGFLATWLGKPYFGKGYNQFAKEAFLWELFTEKDIEVVFLKVNKVNARSLKAMEKLPYAVNATEIYPFIVEQINTEEKQYELFAIYKDAFTIYMYEQEQQAIVEEMEA
ncbi:GNAT family N-acetyltransferase [Bacillaceae bacterium W0354]